MKHPQDFSYKKLSINSNFVKNNQKFAKVVVDKMKEFLNINLEDINQVLKKYYDNENALVIWSTYIENIIK